MKRTTYILLIVCALCLYGCHSKKRLTQTNEQIQVVETPKINSLQVSKAKARVQTFGQDITVACSVNLIADSALVISVQPVFGIELYRLEANEKEVRLFDKLNKRLIVSTYQQLDNELNVRLTFKQLADLFTGRNSIDSHVGVYTIDVLYDRFVTEYQLPAFIDLSIKKADKTARLQLTYLQNTINEGANVKSISTQKYTKVSIIEFLYP